MHQSYLRDDRALERSPVDGGVMRFSNPAPTTQPADAGLAS